MGASNGLLEAALRYAELGYRVFPCAPGGKEPLTEHGFLEATTEVEPIERWWAQYPRANIGIAAAGLLVVDFDPLEGHPTNPWLRDDPDKLLDLAAAPTDLTPRGGRHHVFRKPAGKDWRCTASRLAPKVDTRTDGGYFVVPPSVRPDGAYRWVDGLELDGPPDTLPEPPAWLAAFLDGLAPETPTTAHVAAGGAEANAIPDGQRNATLARLAGSMRRVGMSQAEIAAALARVNTDRCVPPLSRREVELIAASIARYEPDQISVAVVENHYGQMADQAAPEPGPTDPGPTPEELLRVPGFVSEVMDLCLATAPYPNPVMTFGGALALQAFLAGRKVCDPGDNRTNVYLLALAHSSAGKDWIRKLNTRIVHAVGLADALGDRFASGEGVQDSLFLSPAMLFQTDEIDGMLQAINKARDARHESILSTLLTLYSASNSIYPMRRRAGRESPGVIDQPCLVLHGTAIPNHYYEALSERMLTNGFFARMIILESAKRPEGQEPRVPVLSPRLLDTARWWADFRPGSGDLSTWHPVPTVVEHTPEAKGLLITARKEAEAEYAKAEQRGDAVGTTVWGRVNEQARKLALLYAVSADHRSPAIGRDAAAWAIRLVFHQARRMLFMAQSHVAENPFHADCLRLVQKLRDAEDRALAHSVLLKRMKIDTQSFQRIVQTLVEQGDVAVTHVKTTGRTGLRYRLLAE